MRILGIDPGSLKTGFAIIEVSNKKIKPIHFNVIRLEKCESFPKRLLKLTQVFHEILNNFGVQEVAMESLVFVKNPKSLMKLAQARGAILSVVAEGYSDKFFEYSPNLIKSTVSGHGHATKDGVEKMLKYVVGDINYQTDDVSDAMAIAVCHSMLRGQNVSFKKSSSRKKPTLQSMLSHKVKEIS